jgi:hypothetical protein
MAHRFNDNQHIHAGSLPKAEGEVQAGEKMFWIEAFVYQNWPGHYAAALGTNKWAVGAELAWDCQMNLHPDSKKFKKGKARAWALALVSDGPGKRKFYGWGHDVDLV